MEPQNLRGRCKSIKNNPGKEDIEGGNRSMTEQQVCDKPGLNVADMPKKALENDNDCSVWLHTLPLRLFYE